MRASAASSLWLRREPTRAHVRHSQGSAYTQCKKCVYVCVQWKKRKVTFTVWSSFVHTVFEHPNPRARREAPTWNKHTHAWICECLLEAVERFFFSFLEQQFETCWFLAVVVIVMLCSVKEREGERDVHEQSTKQAKRLKIVFSRLKCKKCR